MLAGLLVAGLLAGATGCAQSVDPIERLGKKAARQVRPHGRPGPPAGTYRRGEPTAPGPGRPAGTYRRWGLTAPLASAPRPPGRRPPVRAAGPGLPPVVDRVPTRDKVVFLTYDDSAERDPRFAAMVRELRLPVSLFLTDRVVGPGYGHVARLRAVGASVQNHTLDHSSLRGLPYAGQRAEICGQRDKLRERFGVLPRLLRPPYGTYDVTTLRAAADCGVSAVVLGREPGRDRLRPGDILLGTDQPDLTGTTTRLLRRIQAEGLTPARLEDYL
ncbi:polysaccharide deacetylase family protein [Streptomyces sp. NPDC005907]|uniref:polysaccharide deacetylase family protein n=1 Tax=Streptomyces sp. NPDC005907 TaxID=3154571 RepID=UPI0033E60DA5